MDIVTINVEALATAGGFIAFLLIVIRHLLKKGDEKDAIIAVERQYSRDREETHQETMQTNIQTLSRVETALWRVEKRLEDS